MMKRAVAVWILIALVIGLFLAVCDAAISAIKSRFQMNGGAK